MIIFDAAGPAPGQIQRPVVAIGTFDGMHLGHLAVLQRLKVRAGEWNGSPGVITFQFPPRRLILKRDSARNAPQSVPPALITSLEHRLMLFRRHGLEWAWVMEFTDELSRMSSREFVERIIVVRLSAADVVMGYDNRFGRGGEGGPEEMAEYGREFGFKTDTAEKTEFDGLKVSSSAIREAILAGNLELASKMLGRPVSIYGRIVRGDGRGKELGFPTANVAETGEVRPPPGIYATIALVEGVARLHSVTSIGFRPTFAVAGAEPKLVIETHILDFSGDLYGSFVEVQFVEKLREEKKYNTYSELVEQIKKDIVRARKILKEHEINIKGA